MPEVHAILSASSSKRWLNCTPSARLEQNLPNESSVYAEEGTAAHALGEYKLRKYLHERVKRPTSEYEDEEMEANTDIYAEFIISTVERIKETCPHPLVMVEERLDYGKPQFSDHHGDSDEFQAEEAGAAGTHSGHRERLRNAPG